MSRVSYVDPAQVVNPVVDHAFAEILAVRGTVSNLFRAVANCPSALGPFFGLSRFVRDDSSLPGRVREIAILVTAVVIGVSYEITSHTVAARRVGLSEHEIAALKGQRWAGFSGVEAAVIRYAAEVAATRDVSVRTFQALRVFLSEEQFVELAITIGWYHLVAAIANPLHLELEREGGQGAEGQTEAIN